MQQEVQRVAGLLLRNLSSNFIIRIGRASAFASLSLQSSSRKGVLAGACFSVSSWSLNFELGRNRRTYHDRMVSAWTVLKC